MQAPDAASGSSNLDPDHGSWRLRVAKMVRPCSHERLEHGLKVVRIVVPADPSRHGSVVGDAGARCIDERYRTTLKAGRRHFREAVPRRTARAIRDQRERVRDHPGPTIAA